MYASTYDAFAARQRTTPSSSASETSLPPYRSYELDDDLRSQYSYGSDLASPEGSVVAAQHGAFAENVALRRPNYAQASSPLRFGTLPPVAESLELSLMSSPQVTTVAATPSSETPLSPITQAYANTFDLEMAEAIKAPKKRRCRVSYAVAAVLVLAGVGAGVGVGLKQHAKSQAGSAAATTSASVGASVSQASASLLSVSHTTATTVRNGVTSLYTSDVTTTVRPSRTTSATAAATATSTPPATATTGQTSVSATTQASETTDGPTSEAAASQGSLSESATSSVFHSVLTTYPGIGPVRPPTGTATAVASTSTSAQGITDETRSILDNLGQ